MNGFLASLVLVWPFFYAIFMDRLFPVREGLFCCANLRVKTFPLTVPGRGVAKAAGAGFVLSGRFIVQEIRGYFTFFGLDAD